MQKPARNDPCPCGSGLKYKKCCEMKKATPKKFTAQVLTSNPLASKVQGLTRHIQRPTTPPNPPAENNS